jgi:acetylornithine deacetylase/succinyl-diaminopimelate desuccinylase-like protein
MGIVVEKNLKEAWGKINALIEPAKLLDLALTLGNIDSPAGAEAPAGDYLLEWLHEHGFSPRKIGLVPDRFCVAGCLSGSGGGLSLLFNAHMDTSLPDDTTLKLRPSEMQDRLAWIDREYIVGKGVVNDKGPMAAFMIAADAIRRAGVPLKGDVVLTMVPGEIDQEPVDEFTSTRYLSKEVGSRYLISRGVVADYAVVAEGTDFGLGWAVAGKACFKITVFGKSVYVPFMPPRSQLAKSPNAIIKMVPVLSALEDWAARYESENAVETPGGRIAPKANIGAIRAGSPSHISSSAKVCSVYMDVRLAPEADPLAIRDTLRKTVKDCGVEGEVELYTFRKAQVAQRVDRLVDAVGWAHSMLSAEKPRMVAPAYSSMWRDHLVFIEAGIPAITYGPSGSTGGARPYSMKIQDMIKAAQSYALIALNICSQVKEADPLKMRSKRNEVS